MTLLSWREFAPIVPHLEAVRFYDLASTKPSPRNRDPDWTAGVTLGLHRAPGRWYLVHASRIRDSPAAVLTWMRERWEIDADLFGHPIPLRIEKEGGSSGAYAEELFFREFVGVDVALRYPQGDKRQRFKPFSIAAQNGRMDVVEGWDSGEYFDELELFPDADHDDWADASSGAMRELRTGADPTAAPSGIGPIPTGRGHAADFTV